ncbi:MAG: thioesterase domain-containing protein [Leptolyngbyaceae cyanobacterium bins.302]|nr:thioesterase domain-containing protein [Leptolyngbyaceae cyanobacterium bins.302]
MGEIEATLQRHPAVREAVTIASNESFNETRLITYFSLNDEYLQQTALQSLQTQHLQHWQTLYNQTYHTLHPIPHTLHPTFNIIGWNSSYTGNPIPLEQMQEWVSDRVQQILTLKPKRVLEIGCGTGLLLFQIAPHCQKYVGTDFSIVSLQSIQNQLDPLDRSHVELLHRMATDFEGIDLSSFDVVILNSIVQYFPSQDYLMQVLEGAIQAVAPGGVLFVGDVRSLPLLTAFHTWVQFCQADDSMERSQLQQLVERSRFEEPELAIDPAFFHQLRDRFSQIRQVQIRLSRGHSQNEMTQFRYNVLLHIEQSELAVGWVGDRATYADGESRTSIQSTQVLSNSIQKHNWKLNPITIEEIQKNLIQTEPKIVIITNVTNSRVNAAVKTANWLHNKKAPKTVGRMREILQDSAELAIAPQSWWDLETVLPYTVEITWSMQTDTGDYDVLFMRQGVDAKVDLLMPQQPYPSDYPFINHPLQSNAARQLIPELRQYLKQTLPDYMVPSAFVPLEALPLTSNGKVDRASVAEQSHRALLPLRDDSIHVSNTANAQSASRGNTSITPTEATLMEIWQELLRLKQVHIHDNFFELGGHSLLATQMTSRVRDTFGLELPLKNVFEAPTIAQLAPILETLRDNTSTHILPPLIRLDRSAHRRKRSTLPNTQNEIQNPKSPEVRPPISQRSRRSGQQVLASRSPLIPLTLGDSKQPFFCVHPMFGVVFPYLELAHCLKTHRSFYGLQPLGLDGSSPPLNRIEAIAAYYIQAIQTLQPHGPYFLGGWSFGGLVAFEMAQQLTQAGQQVELLAILDTPAPCNKPSFYQSLKFLLGTALWSTLPFLLDYGALISHRLESQNSWFSRKQWSAIARLIPEESRLQLLDESAIRSLLPIVYANVQATYRYVPQSYPNRLTLFKAAEQPDAFKHEPTLGWSALASDIHLHQVPGNHLSLLKQPHIQTLAQQLGRHLS